jgi:predicted outer membrane repeat protein
VFTSNATDNSGATLLAMIQLIDCTLITGCAFDRNTATTVAGDCIAAAVNSKLNKGYSSLSNSRAALAGSAIYADTKLTIEVQHTEHIISDSRFFSSSNTAQHSRI